MIETLIAGLGGFAASIVPEIFGFFRRKEARKQEAEDRAHELAILQLQMQREEKQIYGRQQEIIAQSDSAALQSALRYQPVTDSRVINGLTALVRPLLALGFFSLYAFVKYAQYQHGHWPVWSETDMAVLLAIVGFYFGKRSFEKIGK